MEKNMCYINIRMTLEHSTRIVIYIYKYTYVILYNQIISDYMILIRTKGRRNIRATFAIAQEKEALMTPNQGSVKAEIQFMPTLCVYTYDIGIFHIISPYLHYIIYNHI